MIQLTKLNNTTFTLNAVYIERIESTPDTVVSLLSGKKMHVLETEQQVADLVTQYYRKINLLTGLQEQAGTD
ncbi:flagellar FlbD family protein [Planococcus lenghuensis]|uniref:Flagellar protein FlbD n=1 Tax=Planococcus lenghuensis TaxID=2213202 RepID=A0A1Q2L0Y4_9BACL|nr:flagellar FlbD family protein [Planococcus lenghuensis]AQQ54125.1 hypothetical protein B0X71_14110 [Planococcus lenghuensis]